MDNSFATPAKKIEVQSMPISNLEAKGLSNIPQRGPDHNVLNKFLKSFEVRYDFSTFNPASLSHLEPESIENFKEFFKFLETADKCLRHLFSPIKDTAEVASLLITLPGVVCFKKDLTFYVGEVSGGLPHGRGQQTTFWAKIEGGDEPDLSLMPECSVGDWQAGRFVGFGNWLEAMFGKVVAPDQDLLWDKADRIELRSTDMESLFENHPTVKGTKKELGKGASDTLYEYMTADGFIEDERWTNGVLRWFSPRSFDLQLWLSRACGKAAEVVMEKMVALTNNPDCKRRRFNDGYYVGHFKEKLRHGNGIFVGMEGSHVYEGEWMNDKKSGTGIEHFGSGERL